MFGNQKEGNSLHSNYLTSYIYHLFTVIKVIVLLKLA